MKALPLPVKKRCSIMQGLAAVSLLLLVAACTTVEAPLQPAPEAPFSTRELCANWLERLDETIDRAGVRDAGAYRIAGFPYLRVDRFSASFRDKLRNNPQAFEAWLTRLKELDAEARRYEIGNLRPQFFPLAGIGDQAAARVKTQRCAALLARADFGIALRRDALVARAKVPDNYVNWKRVLGLYPIASIPFSKGVEKWEQEVAETFRKAGVETSSASGVVRYESAAKPVSEEQVTAIFLRQEPDVLGIPQFTNEERELLLQAYAPTYEIETTGAHDRFGALTWRNGPAPEIDPTRPVAYRRPAFTRF